MKSCLVCEVVKPVTAFYRDQRKADGRCATCKTCKRVAHADSRRAQGLLERYGLTVEEWQAQFDLQEGLCALCGAEEPGHPRGWNTDHCHTTGALRAILCWPCNRKLGVYETLRDTIGLDKVENYLKNVRWGGNH